MVRRALIPCGGRGTRMVGLTGGGAKELLPVAGVPVIRRVVDECVASGIQELLIVTAAGKPELAQYLRRENESHRLVERLEFVEQPDARGLADAIRLGRGFAAGKPIAVALPDNLYLGAEPALAQVIRQHLRSGHTTVALMEISAAEARRRGATSTYLVDRSDDAVRIVSIPDKGAKNATFDTGGAAAAITGVGRYVFTGSAFAAIDEIDRTLPRDRELDDIPVLQHLLGNGELAAVLLDARFFDVGLPAGYHEANEVFDRAPSAERAC